jgi:hypothetical protein
MYPQRMVSQALRLGLLVALVVLALSACGGEKQQELKPQPLPEEQQELRPGVYRSEEFKPSLSFRVGEGWSNSPPEASDALLLQLTRDETVGLGFVNAQEVYKPTKTGTPKVVEAPEDMVGWFQQHPYLRTSEPEPVTVGGVKGVQFEMVVKDLPENYSGPCVWYLRDCVDIFETSSVVESEVVGGSGEGWIAFRKDNKQRLFVLEDVKGKTVTMGFTIPATEFDEQAPEAQKVIDSVEWTGS